ncbi:hypothetical protein COR50_13200 [Chitinophaga caeni]|uniref:Uncharacterized protein n=2 Tax=Chitinophaga caeni TaxID=2029983 RepID=A0A291QVQ6_9BACT|nr:hypothetical protein COR50_13200 [Chitinophaga caeni]
MMLLFISCAKKENEVVVTPFHPKWLLSKTYYNGYLKSEYIYNENYTVKQFLQYFDDTIYTRVDYEYYPNFYPKSQTYVSGYDSIYTYLKRIFKYDNNMNLIGTEDSLKNHLPDDYVFRGSTSRKVVGNRMIEEVLVRKNANSVKHERRIHYYDKHNNRFKVEYLSEESPETSYYIMYSDFSKIEDSTFTNKWSGGSKHTAFVIEKTSFNEEYQKGDYIINRRITKYLDNYYPLEEERVTYYPNFNSTNKFTYTYEYIPVQ